MGLLVEVGDDGAGVRKVRRRRIGRHNVDQRLSADQRVIRARVVVRFVVMDAPHQGVFVGDFREAGQRSGDLDSRDIGSDGRELAMLFCKPKIIR